MEKRYTGDCKVFIDDREITLFFPDAWESYQKRPLAIKARQMAQPFAVHTPAEGIKIGKADDWLIRGVKGELYPCDDAVFQVTYIELEE